MIAASSCRLVLLVVVTQYVYARTRTFRYIACGCHSGILSEKFLLQVVISYLHLAVLIRLLYLATYYLTLPDTYYLTHTT